jgi:LacI family transcriptional regulator
MDTIGVVMAYSQESVTSNPYLGSCLDGILAICKQRHQKVLLYLEDDWEVALTRVPNFCDGHCDGLLLVIPRTNSLIVEALVQRTPRIPLTMIGDSREGELWGAADVDNVRGAREITEHLIGLGHRRIAVFCGNYDFCSNDQRIEGYRQALAGAGIPFDPDLLFPGEYHPEWGERNVDELRKRFPETHPDHPTALFCLCDAIAVGALSALQERKIRVPDEFSVVGFDDIPTAQTLGLTTMRHPIRLVGERAVEVLLSSIEEKVTGGRQLVPAELVVRTTTQPFSRTKNRRKKKGEKESPVSAGDNRPDHANRSPSSLKALTTASISRTG